MAEWLTRQPGVCTQCKNNCWRKPYFVYLCKKSAGPRKRSQVRILPSAFKTYPKFPEKFPEKTEEILSLLREKLEAPRDRLLNMLSKKVGSKLVEKVGSKLVESQIKILLIVSEKPNITKREMSKILGISEIAIDKNIAKLKSLGILKRVGPAKGGYWKVLEDENNEGKIERK